MNRFNLGVGAGNGANKIPFTCSSSISPSSSMLGKVKESLTFAWGCSVHLKFQLYDTTTTCHCKCKQTPRHSLRAHFHVLFVISSHTGMSWYRIPYHRTPGIFMSTISHKSVAKYYIRHAQNKKTNLVTTARGVGHQWRMSAVRLRFLSRLIGH